MAGEKEQVGHSLGGTMGVGGQQGWRFESGWLRRSWGRGNPEPSHQIY